jgi:uncharacterized protein YfdQ (DUF2303 family)
MSKISNIEGKFDADQNTQVLTFDLNGSETLEFLDADHTLCAAHDSNLHNYLDVDTANEVREQLKSWLADNATVSVAVNGVEDFFVINVPANADEDAIREAIETENKAVGGSDAEPVFVEADSNVRQFVGKDVIVTKNGFEITDLRARAA